MDHSENDLSHSQQSTVRYQSSTCELNPLNAKLNPVCYFMALLGALPILHVSRIRVKGGALCDCLCTVKPSHNVWLFPVTTRKLTKDTDDLVLSLSSLRSTKVSIN
jgi:hypothetical protein